MRAKRCILNIGHGGQHLYADLLYSLWWECGRAIQMSQEESLALWEQSEDDEFRNSLIECMDALDEAGQESARTLWLQRLGDYYGW